MNTEPVEDLLRRYRPLDPPVALRARVLAATPEISSPFGPRRTAWALGVGLLVLVAGTSWFWTRHARFSFPAAPAGLTELQRAEFAARWTAQKRTVLPARASGAKVVIAEFVDWLCRPCAPVDAQYREIANRYQAQRPGAVKLVVFDWPWDTACNPKIPRTLQPGACEAAVAVRLAADRGRATEMIEWLFASADPLAADGGTPAAAMIASELTRRFGPALETEQRRRLDEIRADIATGHTIGVVSTPTIFINGVRAADASGNQLPAAYAELAVQLELERGGGLP